MTRRESILAAFAGLLPLQFFPVGPQVPVPENPANQETPPCADAIPCKVAGLPAWKIQDGTWPAYAGGNLYRTGVNGRLELCEGAWLMRLT